MKLEDLFNFLFPKSKHTEDKKPTAKDKELELLELAKKQVSKKEPEKVQVQEEKTPVFNIPEAVKTSSVKIQEKNESDEVKKDSSEDNKKTEEPVKPEVKEPVVEEKPVEKEPVQEKKEEVKTDSNTKSHAEYLLDYILFVEGEYSNDKNDSGGETRFGIIKEEARKWGYTGDMRKLPKEKAIEIYKKDYIEKFKIDKIDHLGKKLAVFDVCVNSGNRGVKLTQRVVNKIYIHKKELLQNNKEIANILPLAEDGIMGQKTIDAVNAIPFVLFYMDYIVAHEDMYHDLMKANGKLYSFEEGWENRIHKENQFIYRLLKDNVITLY